MAGVRPSAPNAVVLLRQIDEPEIQRKSADHGRSLLRGQAVHRRLQRDRGFTAFLARAAPSMDGELANALFQREKRFPFELDEHVAEQAAEPTNVAAERPIDFTAPR